MHEKAIDILLKDVKSWMLEEHWFSFGFKLQQIYIIKQYALTIIYKVLLV